MRALTKPLLYILVSFLTLTMACQDQPADAVTNLIPVTMELGGKSPNIFFPSVCDHDDEFFDKAVEGA